MRVPNDIIQPHVLEYIRGVVPCHSDPFLKELKERCDEEEVPIIEPETESLIRLLLTIRPVTRILEIGTAYGYSAILMSRYLPENGHILTIERNEVMWREAEKSIAQAGLENRIELKRGQASEILPSLKDQYDFVLLDASVGQYEEFFREARRLLKPGGLIFADNVLHGGMVAHERLEIPRRQRTIHSRMRAFLEETLQDPDLLCALEPIGDGVLIAYKKG